MFNESMYERVYKKQSSQANEAELMAFIKQIKMAPQSIATVPTPIKKAPLQPYSPSITSSNL